MNMMEFLNKFFTKTSKSKDVAKDRLKLVLMGDRGVSPSFWTRLNAKLWRF